MWEEFKKVHRREKWNNIANLNSIDKSRFIGIVKNFSHFGMQSLV